MNFGARPAPRGCVFRVSQRDDLWVVTRDNVFYGDYFSRAQAVESACLGARAVEARGGAAEVFSAPGGFPVVHRTK